jgi:hypothetical protein
MEENN